LSKATPYRVAVICTVYNEAILLPLWLTYYGTEFGLENLYLIDDGSTDGSTDNLGAVNVIKIDQPEIDQERRCRDISFFHNEIKRHYDAVIYVDIDEFLVVDPLIGLGLKDFIARSPLLHFNAMGLNVVQSPSTESSYTPDRPIFAQRQFVQFERGYCKQLIHKGPTFWSVGFHNTSEPVALAAGLYLFHLRAFDLEVSIARINGRNKLAWSEESLRKRLGWQNRLDRDAYLQRFYVFDHSRFERATPAAQFNREMFRLATAVSSAPDEIISSRMTELEFPIITMAPRFVEVLPAVRDIDSIAANNLEQQTPPRPDIDPDAVYRKAVEHAERAQQKRLGAAGDHQELKA
jgi:hypothetical protein